jgi:hypothetical protein
VEHSKSIKPCNCTLKMCSYDQPHIMFISLENVVPYLEITVQKRFSTLLFPYLFKLGLKYGRFLLFFHNVTSVTTSRLSLSSGNYFCLRFTQKHILFLTLVYLLLKINLLIGVIYLHSFIYNSQ